MSKTPDRSATSRYFVHSRAAMFAIAALCFVTIGVVAWLILQGQEPDDAVIARVHTHASVGDAGIHVMDVVDTRERSDLSVSVGGRYRVRIGDQSRDGVAGIARINGLIVFVPDTVVGDEVVIEITRLRRSAADGVVVDWLDRADPASRAERETASSERSGQTVAVGDEYIVTIVERDRRNPQNDGVARINGLVVFVPDTQVGDRVLIRIAERLRRAARAEVVEHLGRTENAEG